MVNEEKVHIMTQIALDEADIISLIISVHILFQQYGT